MCVALWLALVLVVLLPSLQIPPAPPPPLLLRSALLVAAVLATLWAGSYEIRPLALAVRHRDFETTVTAASQLLAALFAVAFVLSVAFPELPTPPPYVIFVGVLYILVVNLGLPAAIVRQLRGQS